MTNERDNNFTLDELLTHSLLGETTPEQEERVQAALADDVDLRAEYEARRESLAMLKGVEQEAPTLTATRRDALLRDVEASGTVTSATDLSVGFSWAAALAAIACGAVLLGVLENEPELGTDGDVAVVESTPETVVLPLADQAKVVDPASGKLRDQLGMDGAVLDPLPESERAAGLGLAYDIDMDPVGAGDLSVAVGAAGQPEPLGTTEAPVTTLSNYANTTTGTIATGPSAETHVFGVSGGAGGGAGHSAGSATSPQFMNVPAFSPRPTAPSATPVAPGPQGQGYSYTPATKGGAKNSAQGLRDAYASRPAAEAARREAEARRNRALLDAQQLGKTNSELAKELQDVRETLEEKANLIAAAEAAGIDFGGTGSASSIPDTTGSSASPADKTRSELVRELADARAALQEKTELIEGVEDAGIDFSLIFTKGPQAPISGVVSAVNSDASLLVLSVGANAHVQHGYEFYVYRGDKFIGKAKVQNVLDDMAGARILYVEDGEEMRLGDKVTTRIVGGGASTLPVMSDQQRETNRMLDWIRPRPDETPTAMFFRYWGDNPFVDASKDPLSTFGLDVDTASYTLTRGYIQDGILPPKEAIRTEEFVNYFASNYPAPTDTDLKIYVDRAPSRFAHRENVHLIKVGVKARDVRGERGPLALTLVIDVSGSMETDGRLELVKDAIRTMLTALRPDDSIAIVTFRTEAKVELAPTKVAKIDEILTTLTSLTPDGSTNLEGGLKLAYPLAKQQFQAKGSNRVVIFSDGVANVGLTDPEGILGGVADSRQEGIYLDTFGVGMGNHNDYLLEQLADRGDGSCSYVDTLAEATRIFRKNLSGVFVTVAKDAKIQVEFDPKVVLSYRQIGYENRAIADADFRNDTVDAGEVGAGHEVVALYEVELLAGAEESPATVRLRYQSVGSGEASPEVVELEKKVPARGPVVFDAAPAHFRLSASVAAFAEHLRDSYWARSGHLAEVIEEAQGLVALDTADDKRIHECVDLMRRSKRLVDARPKPTDYGKLLEELKKNNYLRKRYEEIADKEASDVLEELKKQNQELEEKIRKLRGTPR